MAGEWIALALAIGVPLALRLIDYLLPSGRHFRIIDRFTDPDAEEADDDETPTQ